MNPDEVERALFHLRAIAGQEANSFASAFARSVLKQSKRKAWQPSPAQERVMRDLVDQHLAGDLILVEGGSDA